MNALISVILIIAMLFGSAATVSASQDALPTDPLYVVKTFVEDVSLWFNSDPQTEIYMLLESVQTRIEEMIQLTALGVTPPANVTGRLQLHIDQALQVAASMEDAAMLNALQQIRTNLQTQVQVMNILQTQSQGEATQILEQTRTMLETRVRMVENGLTDPQGFRNTIREEKQDTFTGTPGPSYGPGSSGTPEPGGSGFGPQGTPAPVGSENGSTDQTETSEPGQSPGGPRPQGTPAPTGTGSGGAPGSTDQPGQQGPNPSLTPEGSNGPGPGSNPTPGGQGGQGGQGGH